MSIIRTKRSNNFTTVPNSLLNDARLRWNDLGLLVYLLSKPDTWAVRVDALVKERGIGRDSVYESLKRLREHGYAKLIKYSNGTTEWTIFDQPYQDNPDQVIQDKAYPNTDNPDQDNPDQDFPHVLVNTDIKKRLINSKDELSLPAEQKKKPGKPKSKAMTLSEYLQDCKERNVLPIPEDDSIFSYAEGIKLPLDFLRLAWIDFRNIHTNPNKKEGKKRQSSWKQTFRNYVEKNWLKLWFIDNDGNYALTTAGKQLQRVAA